MPTQEPTPPDFLQDLYNVGLSAEDLSPLFRSAYDYLQMWGKSVARSQDSAAARLTAGPGETGYPLSHIGAHNPKPLDSLGYNYACADWGAKEDLNGQAGRPVGETPG
jgi:hypothetical protein